MKSVNLQQVKTDLDNGVIIAKITWSEVLRYAMELEKEKLAEKQAKKEGKLK